MKQRREAMLWEDFVYSLERQWDELYARFSRMGRWGEFVGDVKEIIELAEDVNVTLDELIKRLRLLFEKWDIEKVSTFRAPIPPGRVPDEEQKRILANRLNTLVNKAPGKSGSKR